MITPDLLAYIKKRLAEGTTKENLIQELTPQGWLMSDIQEAFLAVGNSVVTPTPTPSPVPQVSITNSKSGYVWFIIVLVCLNLLVGLVYGIISFTENIELFQSIPVSLGGYHMLVLALITIIPLVLFVVRTFIYLMFLLSLIRTDRNMLKWTTIVFVFEITIIPILTIVLSIFLISTIIFAIAALLLIPFVLIYLIVLTIIYVTFKRHLKRRYFVDNNSTNVANKLIL